MGELAKWGLLGLFIGCFLAATVLPFSSDALYVAVLAVTQNPVGCLVVGTLGNWLGSGIGSYYSAEYIYKDSVHFSQPGTYQYFIRHGMRTDSLEGIHDIGLSVYVKKQD